MRGEFKAEISADASFFFKVDKLKGERGLMLLQGELSSRKFFFEFRTHELRQGGDIK